MVTVGISVTTILRSPLVLPAAFVALIVNLNVPIAVGIPVITPVVSLKIRPAGSVPLAIDQFIGIVPVTLSLWM